MNFHGPITGLQELSIHGYSCFIYFPTHPSSRQPGSSFKADPRFHIISSVNISVSISK